MTPNQLFQVTVSKKHPIKQNEIVKIVKKMSQNEKIWFYFVVPEENYDNFTYQNYVTKRRKKGDSIKKVERKAKVLNNVEQWTLKILTRSELAKQL